MAESTKYIPVNGGTVVSDFKFTNIFSFRRKRTRAFAYVFIAVFVAFTVFLAFNPSPNPSSPWFSNIFTASTFSRSTSVQANGTTNNSLSDSNISQFSSIYSYFFASNSSISTKNSTVSDFNSSISTQNSTVSVSSLNNTSVSVSGSPNVNNEPPTAINNDPPIAPNQTRSAGGVGEKAESLKSNQTSFNSSTSQSASNQAIQSSATIKNGTENGKKSSSDTPKSETKSGPKSNSSSGSNETTPFSVTVNNGTKSSSDTKKSEPKSTSTSGNNQGIGNLMKNLLNCNLFDGEWVRDESYPLYKPGSCSLIDEQFNCFTNGRPDKEFQMLKWKPKACTLPRLDGSHMLQMLRGKRLVFVGDSLNRNMWESLICILRNSVKDQSKVYEASGRHHFRSEPSYSFIFKDYNCTIEFFVAPFIVREYETKDKNGEKKETLRLDLVGSSADQYKNADIVVFNTGHWWTHEKTAKGKDYYQEGSHVYNELNVLEAFRKAMTTWGRWVDANINPSKTLVFFRGYSASHFRGGQWNSGGQCDNEVEPIKNTTYLSPYPDKMKVLEKVLRGMKTEVSYLNITRLTDFRKDGHPSIYRKRHYSEEERRSPLHFQDCSHWCLPGVPDSWNEILYAQLLVNHNKNIIK